MKNISFLSASVLLMTPMLFTPHSYANDAFKKVADNSPNQLVVGAAIRDITPLKNMLPISRKPNVEIVGILDPIHVRVIALQNGGSRSLIITSETGRSLGPQIADAVSKHTGIPLDFIINTATHSHAAPELEGAIDLDFKEGKHVTTQQRWAKYALEQTLAAADDALHNLKPAKVGIGYSESYINVNRDGVYNQKDKSGKIVEQHFLGYNPTGLSDKTVAAIEFRDMHDKPIAFIVNYAVHGTVMHGNTVINGKTGVSSDIPGFVSTYLEEKYNGSVAMWLSGAAGDQAPIIQNDMITRDPKTGEWKELFSNNYDMLSYLSRIHFYDVERALDKIKNYSSDSTVNMAYAESGIPSNNGTDNASVSLQMLRIGDIALTAASGELFTSTGMAMKKNSPLKNTIVINHAWQRFSQSPNYFPDDHTIQDKGFGADRAYYKPGYLTPTLTKLTNLLVKETTDWIFNGDGTATSHKSGKTVIIGLDHTPGTKDDNCLVNPAGKVVLKNVQIQHDSNGKVYVNIGNGFHVYPGADNNIGTEDDVVVDFGHYPQSDDKGVTSESIEWRILDISNNKATLASNKILDAVKFNLSDKDGNEWANSNLRAWLNSKGGSSSSGDKNGLFNRAFSKDEQHKMIQANVDMNPHGGFIAYNRLLDNNWWKDYSTKGTSTSDYVWVLSGEDVRNYFGNSKIATQNELGHSPKYYTNAYFSPTKYAHSNGVKVNEGGNGPSFIGYGDVWTRSKGAVVSDGTYNGVFIGSTGSLNSGRPVTRDYGVVPVIMVNLM